MTFCFIQCRQNDVRANDVSGKRRSTDRGFIKMMFGWTTIRKNVRHYEVSLIRRFDHVKIRSIELRKFRQNNDSAKLLFGKTTIRWNNVSGKWCGPIVRQLIENSQFHTRYCVLMNAAFSIEIGRKVPYAAREESRLQEVYSRRWKLLTFLLSSIIY